MEDSEAYTDANIIGGNIYYNPDTGEITSCDKEVISAVIPSSINGVRITSIGGRAFYKCENLIKAEIPDSVKSIDISSLRSCSNLTVFCHENSYAKAFAVENNINYKII